MLQRNVLAEVRQQQKREYRDSMALVKRLVRESKERVDEDFGRQLSAEYMENKKLFWREVRPYRVESEAIFGCKIWLGKGKLEGVK